MSNFMGVRIFWIGLNRADLGCWRLTLTSSQLSIQNILKAHILFIVKENFQAN